jgi:hypothetical protein
LSAVETKGTIVVKNPRWESELWSYIGRSDGKHCPLYNSCRARIETGLCPCEDLGRFRELLDAKQFNADNYDDFITDTAPDRMLRLVGKMADRYLKKGGVKYPPVPNELIFLADDKHPIEVRLVSLKAYHGATWHLKDGWVIHLNKNDPPSIRRFTLFHEAFHIISHVKFYNRLIRKGANRDKFHEFLAELFAESILMPMIWIRQRWAEVRDLDRMAEIFDVPKPAMYIRLKLQNLI